MKQIIIISNEAWSDIWFSKHHYAHELSKSNTVFFINPPLRWRPANLFKKKIRKKKLSENLTVLEYDNFLPHKFLELNNRIVSRRLADFISIHGPSDIFWSFDPMRLFDPRFFKVKKSIFHAVDKYLFKHPAEKLLHQNVDGFVVVADEIAEQYKPYKKPILHVPHGISSDENELEKGLEIPYDNYIFYMGMIDARIDFDFVEQLVKRFPDELFLFVGDFREVHAGAFDRLFINKEFKNLIRIPAVHALNLKYYVAKAKCCLAPMSDAWAGNMISHHKILQYLAHGKAVFSPVFTAYTDFSALLYMDNDKEALSGKIQYFLQEGESKELSQKRILLAHRHTYESHVGQIINFINLLE